MRRRFQLLKNALFFSEGPDAVLGVAVLVGGTVTVSSPRITANSRIFLSPQTSSGTPGHLDISIVPGTSFTITSTSGTDTRSVAWLIVEPA